MFDKFFTFGLLKQLNIKSGQKFSVFFNKLGQSCAVWSTLKALSSSRFLLAQKLCSRVYLDLMEKMDKSSS